MKNKLIFLFFGILLFAACQPTPDVAPVVNKSEGLPPGAIIEAVPEGEIKVIDAPGHWSETIERMEGHIKVAADADVSVPQISNTPVIELKQYDFTDERLSELVNYFADDAKLYKEPKMTKAELEEILVKIENKEGEYSIYTANERERMAKKVNKLLETAPDNVDKEYVEAMFSEQAQSDLDYILNKKPDFASAEISFKAFVEDGDGNEALLQAEKYDPDAGSFSRFQYSQGSVYDEADLAKDEQSLTDLATRDNGLSGSEEQFENEKKLIDESKATLKKAWESGVLITQEVVLNKAAELFVDLGVNNMALYGISKGVLVTDDGATVPGYSLVYYHDLQGLTGYWPEIGTIYTDLPEQLYAPSFIMENIYLFISDNGIQSFSWNFMTDPVRVVAENTELLSFEEVAGRLADHFYYVHAKSVDDKGNPIFDSRFEVINAELRSGYVNAFEAPQNVWLVPVWRFEIKEYRIDPMGNERYFSRLNYMFNAIDGGYISLLNRPVKVPVWR